MLKKKKNNKGFTLVELLVVIAIIGILAVVAVPALFSNINKAKIADLEADYSAIKSAALSYYTDNNGFTATTNPVIQDEVTSGNGLSEYMESMPEKSPFGTVYKITAGDATSGNDLFLETTLKNPLKQKEADKLRKDLGDVVKQDGSSTASPTNTIKLQIINNK